jgi:PAS domain S-box-containing protein
MARLTAILESTSDLVSTATPDGSLTYLNRAGRLMVGWDESDDISGKAIADLHPAWAYERIMQEGIPATLDTGTWRGETALIHRDGREIPVSQVIMAHRGLDSQLRYLSTVMRDISDVRKATEELRRSEALYRNVVENANELIVIIQDGMVRYCNPKTYELSGYTHDEIMSKPFLEFVHPDDHASIMDRYIRRMAGERLDDTYYFRLLSKARGMRWFEVRARLIEWEGGPPSSIP